MAKTNIIFNNKTYSIDDSSLSAEKSKLEQHLSTTMNGTGAVISLGGTAYNIDSAKLTTARNDFTTHLGTISGNGKKIVIGGVEYSVGSDKVAVAIGELEAVLGGLNSGSDSGETYTAGLYQTGAIALYEEQGADAIEGMMIKSWDELLADETVIVDNGAVYTKVDMDTMENLSSDALVGDLLLPFDGSITKLGDIEQAGYPAFYACKNLTSVIIPDSVTSISHNAFSECTNLSSITIPDGVTEVGWGIFKNCANLSSINIPACVTSIVPDELTGCLSLTELTVSPNNSVYHSVGNCIIETASKMLVRGCDTSIIPTDGSVISIADMAFLYANFTSINIPNSVTSLGHGVFSNCDNLSNVIFEENCKLTTISRSTFSSCDNLIDITLPDGITSILAYAFNFSGLNNITIPSTVNNIDFLAFGDCENLKTINFKGTVSQWNAITKHEDWKVHTPAIQVLCSDGEVSLA